ncbi:hypothetical protein SAMN02745975_03016 [Geosporobacter subterraneus DSM 17957]|uniref:Uncharacterized protein n=1 Tax=Geosporobacter subterraneus DSM 17957 TaxID=1121919 RepID=A0A1M6MKJ4_9FIRM|nr:hypothetical protein [Geosporobacter subterraneus]SHJ84001.1 hypothetical protein SAMN02745975_03016 [Geosporobacter subterraneus DSM 17957]
MDTFKLMYNSFLWGLGAAIIAFQIEWLEMRMNIGIIIPVVAVISFFIVSLIRRMKKAGKYTHFMNAKFTTVNLIICLIIAVVMLGLNRIQVVPAAIIREALGLTYIKFSVMNLYISSALLIGLGMILYSEINTVHKK